MQAEGGDMYAVVRTLLAVGLAVGLAVIAEPSLGQTFTSNTPITFAGSSGGAPASAYPAGLVVSGVGTVQYMTISLNGVQSTSGSLDAFAALLVGPSGIKCDLGSISTGPTNAPLSFTITFADDASGTAPNPVVASAAFKPGGNVPLYPPPAPAGPYSSALSGFNSVSASGTWSLYVLANGNARTIASGWSLTFNGARQPQPIGTAFTYQGRLEKNGAPVHGTADLRFSLWNNPTSTNTSNRIGGPLTKSSVAVDNGVFTTSLDFGGATDDATGLWMDVEAASPPGSGFVAISPRQLVGATPQAVRAKVATAAESFSISSDSRLNDKTLYLRSGSDINHGLGWFGSGKFFAGQAIDGPAIFGYSGGVLGSKNGQTERNVLQWTSAGRVGINVQSPDARLHIEGDSTNDLGLLIAASGAGWGSGLRLENFGAGGRTYGMYSASDGTWQFVDQTATATRMVINSTGNVGIGTTSLPQKLNVNGTIRSTGADFMLAGRGGGQGNNGGNARAFVDAGWTGNPGGVVDGGGLYINYANDFGRVVVGSSLVVQGNINASGTITPSSARLKEHVAPIDDALQKLLMLDGVRFDWKGDEIARRGGRVHDLGFVAEDVEKLFPEVVFRDATGSVVGMDYARLTAVTVQAIKQQQAQREADRREIGRLAGESAAKQKEIDDLRARLERLEASLK